MRVQPVLAFPSIRHAVIVAVDGRRLRLQLGPATDFRLGVDDVPAMAAHLAHDPRVHGIAHRERCADRRQHELQGRRRRNRGHRRRGKRLGHRLHLAFAVDHRRIEKARVVRGQVVVALEDVVANVVEQVRGTADPDGRGRLAARAGPDVVRDIVDLELALGEAGARLAVVVDDIVPHIEGRIGRPAVIVPKARVAGIVVDPEVVVPGHRSVRAGQRAVAVRALGVLAAVQRLADEAPLDGQVRIVAGKRQALVDRPGGGAVVEDRVARTVIEIDAVLLHAGDVAEAAAQVPHNHVMGSDLKRVVAQADAVARRRLAREGEVGIPHDDGLLEGDRPGHPEQHEARTLGVAGGPQAAGSGVVQIRDEDDPAAAPARRGRTESFGPGESRQAGGFGCGRRRACRGEQDEGGEEERGEEGGRLREFHGFCLRRVG